MEHCIAERAAAAAEAALLPKSLCIHQETAEDSGKHTYILFIYLAVHW